MELVSNKPLKGKKTKVYTLGQKMGTKSTGLLLICINSVKKWRFKWNIKPKIKDGVHLQNSLFAIANKAT